MKIAVKIGSAKPQTTAPVAKPSVTVKPAKKPVGRTEVATIDSSKDMAQALEKLAGVERAENQIATLKTEASVLFKKVLEKYGSSVKFGEHYYSIRQRGSVYYAARNDWRHGKDGE